jgi:hypothetical protein
VLAGNFWIDQSRDSFKFRRLVIIMGSHPLRTLTQYRAEEYFICYMLHPSDVNLYALRQNDLMCVLEKNKIYCIIFEPSCSRYKIPAISKAHKTQICRVLSWRGATYLWFWGKETGRTASKFYLRVDFEILEGWQERNTTVKNGINQRGKCSVTFMRLCGIVLYSHTATDDNMAHAHPMLNN